MWPSFGQHMNKALLFIYSFLVQNHIHLLAHKKLLRTRVASLMACFIKRKRTSSNLVTTERQLLERAIPSAGSKPYDDSPCLRESFFFLEESFRAFVWMLHIWFEPTLTPRVYCWCSLCYGFMWSMAVPWCFFLGWWMFASIFNGIAIP